jgi:hypothetical protein
MTMETTQETTPTWYYCESAGGHQGLIADEQTGKTIAVSYDKVNAPLLAAAPKMLKALENIQELAQDCLDENGQPDALVFARFREWSRAAIEIAKG